jgi:putative transposase
VLITDAYSKKIVGYNISDSLNVSGSLKALEMAFNNRIYKNRTLINHSDRGLQYCSNEYQKLLDFNNTKPSMTENTTHMKMQLLKATYGILK